MPPAADELCVALGPSLELHRGYHGSLLDDPPPGVRYVQPAATHRFAYAERGEFPFNPFHQLAAAETVLYDLPEDVALIHSCRTPAGHALPWVVDSDDIVVTLEYGQCFALGSQARIRSGEVEPASRELRRRTMLARYLDPRCRRVLLWTELARRAAVRFVEGSGSLDAPELAAFCAKLDVLYPAVKLPVEQPRAGRPIVVLCTGRTFEDKGGELAISALAALRERFGAAVEPVLVGDVPAHCDARRRGIQVLPVLQRADYLALLSRAHVFFSPTEYESFGMALLEAAAAGAAIVTSCGRGMEHIAELFDRDRHAILIPNEWPAAQRREAYVRALTELVRDASLRERMGRANRELVAAGPFCSERRRHRLRDIYDDALRARQPSPGRSAPHGLALRALPEQYLGLELATRTGNRAFRLHF
jgi:glycosyltransferase involved in cell wall biosynthesis